MKAVFLLFHDVYAADPAESGFRSPAANRYKLAVADFEAQIAGLFRKPDSGFGLRGSGSRIPNPPRLRSGQAESRVPVVITVDDGGVSYYTVVANTLERVGLRGHCFISTDYIGQRGFLSAAQIRELDARGHVIGTHSASHPARFSSLTPAEMRLEWATSRATLEDIVGHSVTVGSVPGGYFSAEVGKAAAQAALELLFTSEPTSQRSAIDGCVLAGRFTIRRGHPQDMARRFSTSSWARCGAWIDWNAKALVKPVLGPSYARIADWILAERHG
jgi:peptidoglycan/xylan/chitin deacetylase (PgdA/CDA1 family)